MAITLDQVRQWLDSDEPNYQAAAKLGIQLIPHLDKLVRSSAVEEAAKAASLASFIDDDRAVEVLRTAAQHPSPLVRLAAAGGLGDMKRPAAAGVLMTLLEDKDSGVRKQAMKAAATRGNAALLAKIADLSRRDPKPTLRAFASQVVSRARRV